MKVVISGGGSGGHIYPALSILRKLQKEVSDLEVVYVGKSESMESRIVDELGIDFFDIDMIGTVHRGKKTSKFRLLKCLVKSYFKLKKFYKEFKPDIVIGTGGYVTVPVVYVASRMKIKTLIFDADYHFGRATRTLLKYADTVCCGFKKNEELGGNIVYTNNPRAQEVFEEVEMEENPEQVLFVFGSLGSKTINDFFINYFNNNSIDDNILYVTGSKRYDYVVKRLVNSKIRVVPYIENIYEELKRTKFVVSRSGATFLSEVEALAIPPIFIPSPHVTNNEQLLNASVVKEYGGCEMLLESEISDNSFKQSFENLKMNYDSLKSALIKNRKVDSLDVIWAEIRKLVYNE